jgi:hypothetical protein
MSDERQWADWKELGRGSLRNFDRDQQLTIYQFIISMDSHYYDKYIQAHDLDEAKDIVVDQIIEEGVDLATVTFYLITIPSNDILHNLTMRTKH